MPPEDDASNLGHPGRAERGADGQSRASPGLLLSQSEAWNYLGLSRSAWYRLRSAGKVPLPVSVFGAGPHWRRADLDNWVSRLKPARSKATA